MNTRGEPVVPAFTISVLGSSWNALIFGFILSSFLCLSSSWHSILPWACHYIERDSKGARMRKKKRIIWTAVHRNCKFWDIIDLPHLIKTDQIWLLTEDGKPEDDEGGGGGGGHAASLRSGEGEALRTQPALWSRATCCPTIYINSTSGET